MAIKMIVRICNGRTRRLNWQWRSSGFSFLKHHQYSANLLAKSNQNSSNEVTK
jgi:hypothetical protein